MYLADHRIQAQCGTSIPLALYPDGVGLWCIPLEPARATYLQARVCVYGGVIVSPPLHAIDAELQRAGVIDHPSRKVAATTERGTRSLLHITFHSGQGCPSDTFDNAASNSRPIVGRS